MECEERVAAIVQEVMQSYRLEQFSPLRPFASHVAWFLVQSTCIRFPDLCGAGSTSEVVKRCDRLLKLKDCPALEIIQLQFSIHGHMFTEQMALAKEEHELMTKREAILRSILSIQVLDRREANLEAERLQKLVIELIMETSRWMDEDFKFDLIREEEISSALDSVFPRTGFLYWINQSDIEKVSQLQELSNIIPGIRAYNRARDESCNASNDALCNFQNEAKDMKDRVEAEANCVEERIHAYRKAIELHIQTLGIHHVLMQRLRDELHYDLQLLCFLQDLQSVLTETHLRMSRLSERLQEQLQILSATIGSQTCIPNELVFPEFQKVGLLQKRASAEFRKFRSQSRVVEQIFILSNKPNFKRTPIGIAELKTSCGLSKIKVLADYCDFLPAHVYSSTSLQAEIPEPSVMSNRTMEDIVIIDGKEASYMRSTRLYLNGFCLMSIILNGGLLQLGDPKAGLVRIGDKNYTFSTNSALNQFVNSPASYLDALEKMVIAMPQLINTLGLQREPKFAQLAISKVLELVNKRPLRQEFGTQTTTHIQQEHQFDEDTLFLRSKELESKQTHSTQTCGSHFSRDSSSQVWLPRDKSTQSLFGKGTTMPLRLKYFENLRGPPDFKFNPVDILLDV